MTILKIWNTWPPNRAKSRTTRVKSQSMLITLRSKWKQIYRRCMNKNKKEDKKKYSMLERFKDRKNREENREHQTLSIS